MFPQGLSEHTSKAELPLEECIHVKAFDEAANFLKRRLARQEKKIDLARARSVFYAFLGEQLRTAKMYRSEAYGVSFMYAVVDSATIAKQLYRKYAKMLPKLQTTESEKGPSRIDFIFGSYISNVPGALFTFFEQGLQQVVNELPQALADIQNGKEPTRHEIYFVSSPARDIGYIGETFMQRQKKEKAFDLIGGAYAELIGTVSSHKVTSAQKIGLRGESMGASFAIRAAEKLLTAGSATQSSERAEKPFLEVRIDAPPAQTKFSPMRRWFQMRAGFLLHSVATLATSRYVRATSNPFSRFMKDVSPLLKEQGIARDLSTEQARRKNAIVRALLSEMDEGVPVPRNVRLTEVLGLFDLTTFSARQSLGAFVKEVVSKLRRQTAGDRPFEGAIPVSETDNRKTYGIIAGHNFPNFPPATVRSMYDIDQILKTLGKGKS